MDQYRINKSYDAIYEYDADNQAYIYLTRFSSIGASSKDSDEKIIEKIEQWKINYEDMYE